MPTHKPSRYQFEEFVADLATGELYRKEERIYIQEKPFQFLAVLLESNGAVVTREELSERMWPDTHVQVDQGLNAAVRKVRLALADDATNPRFIETLGSRGYRFIAPFTRITDEPVAGVRIAVLPFENESHLNTEAADALRSELVSQLSEIEGLQAIASDARQYGGGRISFGAIRQELDVAYLVRVKVRANGEFVTLSAELLSGEAPLPLWTESYEKAAHELQSLQRTIALQIGSCLARRQVQELHAEREVTFSAFESYMRGRHFWNKRNPPALLKSVDYFKQSIAQDPGYALAYAGLADSYNMLAVHGTLVPRVAYAKAKEYAQRALDIQPNLPQALVPLAWAQLGLDRDIALARRGFERAIALNPNYAFAHNGYSYLLLAAGDVEGSIAAMRRGRDLDPLSLPLNSLLSNCYFYARDYDMAARQAELAIELDHQFPVAHACAGLAYWSLGRNDEAVRAFERAVAYSREAPVMIAHLAYVLALTEHESRAREIAEDLADPGERGVAPVFHIGLIYLALEQQEEALDWIEKSCEERFHWTLFLDSDPRLDVLRGDERFEKICESLRNPTNS